MQMFPGMSGGDALVTSGIMESLLQVLEWKAFEPMNITVSLTVYNLGGLRGSN